ncbi:phosphate/phosphite/phosphonate ABC transporter substrate-binding protein [Shimia sp. R11_0]|uniref:phosphate/phosphite/phosphonate ABC transporter substrate-binding protein n=1 Tax=Shimia sp. R11_0 TaxID=2821096 RepID=UPI001ADCC4D9|nr:PhnD/SsuA/transferrin family substrate-binding protein [Shimia sp. R11_0]MBO9476199.1 phosphate/phosphite/phosphonate ABC transporter substrate-binding protein [Shimia sp. R11_0]
MLCVKRVCAALICCLISFASLSATAETLTIGTLNEGVRAQMRAYESLVSYLQTHLEGSKVTRVRVLMLPTSDRMSHAMMNGEVDVFMDSPLVAAKVARVSGAKPTMRHWKKGESSYYAVLVTNVDSGITSVSDLKGKKMAFEEKDSTSGFLLPAQMLLKSGLKLHELHNISADPKADEVGYVFSAHDKNSIYLLASGRVDAIATNPESLRLLQEVRPDTFVSFAKSPTVPRQVLLHRAGMDPDILHDLRTELANLYRTPDGREVLKKFQNSSGFDDFPEGAEAAFVPIYEILDDLEGAGLY